jgi:hypothetical protein
VDLINRSLGNCRQQVAGNGRRAASNGSYIDGDMFKRRHATRTREGSPAGGLRELLPDASPHELHVIRTVRPFTMTSPERILALVRAVRWIIEQGIPGDFVECGVWRGGSVMAIILALQELGCRDRGIWLYDTFSGMSAPSGPDVDFRGNRADTLLAGQLPGDPASIWCYSTRDEVRRNVESLGYPERLLNFVEGPVETTLASGAPMPAIALLRLDTDWYESTMMELQVLFPQLADGGVLIIDDYGHWRGCRRAVDEYFATHRIRMFLNRIDYTGRIGIHHAPSPNCRLNPEQVP